MGPHFLNERSDSINGSRNDEPAVIKPEANPQIVHEHGEPNHHGGDAPWTAKLPPIKQFELAGRTRMDKKGIGGHIPGVRVEELVGLAPFVGDDSLGRALGGSLTQGSGHRDRGRGHGRPSYDSANLS